MPPPSAACSAIIAELKTQGNATYRAIMLRHRAQEPIFGVKIEYLKTIQKRIKQDYQLAKELFDSGIYDAMYLAGLIADDRRMTKADLQRWVKNSRSSMIGEYTVAWVAAESGRGWELGTEWIDSRQAATAASGWATLASVVAITPDDELDLPGIKKLLGRVEKTIQQQPDRVRYCMNNFVIAVGTYIRSMTDLCLQTGKKIGTVMVEMQGTDCKVPSIAEAIGKAKKRGALGKKRKSAKC